MKHTILMVLVLIVSFSTEAQKKPMTDKIVEGSEKINKKSKQINEASGVAAVQISQTGENTKAVANNIKAIIKVFEPIFRIHLKMVSPGKSNGEKQTVLGDQARSNTDEEISSIKSTKSETYYDDPGESVSYNEPTDYQPVSNEYNSDGTANWGNQYNAEFGNFLDAFTGSVVDRGSAENNPEAVDLIFLAPNDGQNAYYLISPNFARDGYAADALWGSATTDNPVKTWKSVNASEVALTTITGQQFDKIQYNVQLKGALKQARGFASFFSSTTKLDGKVFALKSEINNRTAYALIYVVRHIGTSGSQGYLKVKIKCTGFDKNGDGQPDITEYSR